MAATLRDIAEEVGVSQPTVSIVLNNRPKAARVTERTKERIFRTAERLGYRPNAAARALATQRTRSIGYFLSADIHLAWSHPYFGGQLTGVEAACRERGYTLQIRQYNLNDIASFVVPDQIGQSAVDGIIVSGWVQAEVMQRLNELRVPCVSIGDSIALTDAIPTVSYDFVGAHLQGLSHAAELGHRRIGVFGDGPRFWELITEVEQRAANDPALPPLLPLIRYSRQSPGCASPAEFAHALAGLPVEERPTFLFAGARTLMQILQQFRDLGIRCPEDISLCAQDTADLCALATPALTGLCQHLPELGRTAANVLIDHLENGKRDRLPVSHNTGKGSLVIRQSTARIGTGAVSP